MLTRGKGASVPRREVVADNLPGVIMAGGLTMSSRMYQGGGQWANEFAHEAADANGDWADEFARGVAAPFTADGTDIDRWADEFDTNAGMYHQEDVTASGEYMFSPNNPFLQVLHCLPPPPPWGDARWLSLPLAVTVSGGLHARLLLPCKLWEEGGGQGWDVGAGKRIVGKWLGQ